MKLKCIGGERDGHIQDCDDNLKRGDIVNVMERLKFEWSAEVPVKNYAQYYPYRICQIHGTSIRGEKLTLKYLCPSDWHEWEAIKHQFGK